MRKINYLLMILLLCGVELHGQNIEADLYDLSLEELMNIEIVAVSKKAERSFESPLSATVVTKDEIIASGVTTIEEALRLVPGMVVREESNGNFDPHIRGNDNLPPGNFTIYTENSMSLIMIDGRPIYNYGFGGTFWEAIPISLVDVERIEVVRGPSTSLYGPNAVTGVVNIITRKATEKSVSVNGNAQVGTDKTGIYDLSVGTSLLKNKMKVRVSGNIENRNRSQETYYAYAYGAYVPAEEVPDYLSPTLETRTEFRATPEIAKERKGLNTFLSYASGEDFALDLSLGLQDSYAQSAFFENLATPLGGRSQESRYASLNATVHGFEAQFGYSAGMYNILVSDSLYAEGSSTLDDLRLDFNVTTANLEYNWDLGKLAIRPGLNYQRSENSDLDYGGKDNAGSLNAKRVLSNFGYFVRADYSPTEKLRFIAAVRGDNYNVSDENYLSYQFASTYNLSDKHLIRAVVSQANRGPFMIDTYSDFQVGDGFIEPIVIYRGNEHLELPIMQLFEIGYRGILSPKLTVDSEVFYSTTSNIVGFNPTELTFDPSVGVTAVFDYLNLDLKTRQLGATISLTYAPSEKVQLKAHTTLQTTQLEDYDKTVVPMIVDPANGVLDLPVTERMDVEHKQTPKIYGGIVGNFRPFERFNLFTNMYYMTAHTYRHDFAAYDESKGQTEVSGFAVFNVKAAYMVYKNSSVFINARNVFNNKKEQFGFADEIAGLYLFGVNLSF